MVHEWNGGAHVAALHAEIGAFLTRAERCSLARASKLLRVLGEQPHTAPEHAADLYFFSSTGKHAGKVTELHAWLVRNYQGRNGAPGKGKSKRRQREPAVVSAAKLGVVMRDLVLVALGIRASCLVDCCALDSHFVAFMFDALTSVKLQESVWGKFGCSFNQVYAVILEENVFFVNVQHFLRQKSIDVASRLNNLVVVNVNAHLQQPQAILPCSGSASSSPAARADDIRGAVETICRKLVDVVLKNYSHTSSGSRVLELQKSNISTTALAGILLCYPVIYDLYDSSSSHSETGGGDDGGWEIQENCLAMCPLFVLQTSISRRADDATASLFSPHLDHPPSSSASTTVLQEFSIPQCVLESLRSNEPFAVSFECDFDGNGYAKSSSSRPATLPTLASLRASCKLQIARALVRSTDRTASSCSSSASNASIRMRGAAADGTENILPNVLVVARTLDRVAL